VEGILCEGRRALIPLNCLILHHLCLWSVLIHLIDSLAFLDNLLNKPRRTHFFIFLLFLLFLNFYILCHLSYFLCRILDVLRLVRRMLDWRFSEWFRIFCCWFATDLSVWLDVFKNFWPWSQTAYVKLRRGNFCLLYHLLNLLSRLSQKWRVQWRFNLLPILNNRSWTLRPS